MPRRSHLPRRQVVMVAVAPATMKSLQKPLQTTPLMSVKVTLDDQWRIRLHLHPRVDPPGSGDASSPEVVAGKVPPEGLEVYLPWQAALRLAMVLQRAASAKAALQHVRFPMWVTEGKAARLAAEMFIAKTLKRAQDLEQVKLDASDVRMGRKRQGKLALDRVRV